MPLISRYYNVDTSVSVVLLLLILNVPAKADVGFDDPIVIDMMLQYGIPGNWCQLLL